MISVVKNKDINEGYGVVTRKGTVLAKSRISGKGEVEARNQV